MGTPMDTDFTITEDAFRAVIETCANLAAACQVLTREAQAATEAVIILNHRLDHVEDVLRNYLQPA